MHGKLAENFDKSTHDVKLGSNKDPLKVKGLNKNGVSLLKEADKTGGDGIELLSSFEDSKSYKFISEKLTVEDSAENKAKQIQLKIIQDIIKQGMARRNFKDFVEYMIPKFKFSKFNLDLIEKLQKCSTGEITRLIVNMPPRHGKTFLISELFPVWLLGNSRNESIFNVGYAVSLAKKTSKRALALTMTNKFKRIFPDFQITSEVANRWELPEGGKYYGIGVKGGILGDEFSYGIIDDPVKDAKEAQSPVYQESIIDWFKFTFSSRKRIVSSELSGRVKEPVIIIVMQRWNVYDLVGHLKELQEQDEDADKWVECIYKAYNEETGEYLFPEALTPAQYEKQKANIGFYAWEAMYQQNPIATTGGVFNREDFNYFYSGDFDKANSNIKKDEMIWGLHIDPAFGTSKSADDGVAALVGYHPILRRFYLYDIRGGQLGSQRLRNEIFRMIDICNGDGIRLAYISVEKSTINQNQSQFIVDLKDDIIKFNHIIPVYEFESKENKQQRISNALEPYFNNGLIYILNKDDEKARGNELIQRSIKKLEDELIKFPKMTHDDYPDVLTQAVLMLPNKGRNFTKSQKEKEQNKSKGMSVFNPLTGETRKI